MKNRFRICSLITVGFLLVLMNCCKKDDDVRLQFNPDLIYGTATDLDGNVYKTITIGTQTWMAENLKVSRFNDGTIIPLVYEYEYWGGGDILQGGQPAYSWPYDNPITYKNTYGAFYNWYAVNTGKLCPAGWHIPDNSEWNTLINYLGGDSIAGGKMKESGTKHWEGPNLGATNESGFTALPSEKSSLRDCQFWSSTECVNTLAWNPLIEFNSSKVFWNISNAEMEFPVRCIKD